MTTRGPRRLVSAVLLGVVLAGCGGTGDGTSPDPGSRSTGPSQPTTAAEAGRVPPAARARRVGAPTPEAPALITLPDGSSVPVRVVSTTRDGVLDVPADVRQAGWWRGGSRLGDPFGSTLIAAHVDSVSQGLGPFASLLQVRPGDRVRLRSEHLGQTFEITALEVLPRASFAEQPRLRSPHGPRRLVLVTCAPPFDASRDGYQNLAVLTGTPVSGPTDRRPR